MNFSDLKSRAYEYLSYSNVSENEISNLYLKECYEYLTSDDHFRYLYKKLNQPMPFMQCNPYVSYLNGASEYFIFLATLGSEVDVSLAKLWEADKNKAIIFDACINAYLEIRTEQVKKTLSDNLSYLFSPGYEGSDIYDLKHILAELDSNKIGVRFNDSGVMTPSKTLAGIYAVGVTSNKKCGNCLKLNDCVYRKAGKLCFHLEKK